MQQKVEYQGKFKWMEEKDVRKLNNQVLIEKVKKTSNILKQCEVLAKEVKEVKEDYGKQKIARLRVDFISHQLKILLKECSKRGIRMDEITYPK